MQATIQTTSTQAQAVENVIRDYIDREGIAATVTVDRAGEPYDPTTTAHITAEAGVTGVGRAVLELMRSEVDEQAHLLRVIVNGEFYYELLPYAHNRMRVTHRGQFTYVSI